MKNPCWVVMGHIVLAHDSGESEQREQGTESSMSSG